MKLLGAVLVSALAFGCGGKQGEEYAPLVERAARFEKNACACKDMACAEAEQKAFSEFLSSYTEKDKKADAPASVKEQVKTAIGNAQRCVHKFDSMAEPAGSGGAGGGTGQVQGIIDRLAKAKDAMCACQDLPCIQKVSEELSAFSADLAKLTEVPTDAQIAAMTELSDHASECMTKVAK